MRSVVWILLVVSLLGLACSTSEPEDPRAPEALPATSVEVEQPLFKEVTRNSGISFEHRNGGTGKKYLPEIMGAGGCVLDFDNDGLLDVYLVQSGSLVQRGADPAVGNRLFRNRGGGGFEDVTAKSGLDHPGYGMGAIAGDYDNDGDADIYLINFGADVLFRNDGDGQFTDVTAAAGIDSSLWGSSALFFDPDLDGDLDLYVVNYLDYSIEKNVDCGTPSRGILSYCSPDVYESAPDTYYRNRGDGTFQEWTKQAGFHDDTGKGLGAVAADFTGDGSPDLYVANDSTPNFLFVNQQDGTFEEAAVLWGVGHNEEGLTEAGMGADAGDVNGDGRLDLFVTNLNNESNALYLGGEFEFSYHSRLSRIYELSFLLVGFGTDLLDLDNDGDLDIVVANGHVIDNVEQLYDGQTFRQPGQAFLNEKGHFSQIEGRLLGGFGDPRVGRATLTLDFDNDGFLDLLVTENNGPANVFRNTGVSRNHFIGFALQGCESTRDAVGTRVTVTADGTSQVDEKKVGSSYQSSNDPRLHFGLGSADQATVEIRWLNGQQQRFEDLAANRYYHVVEGEPPREIERQP